MGVETVLGLPYQVVHCGDRGFDHCVQESKWDDHVWELYAITQ